MGTSGVVDTLRFRVAAIQKDIVHRGAAIAIEAETRTDRVIGTHGTRMSRRRVAAIEVCPVVGRTTSTLQTQRVAGRGLVASVVAASQIDTIVGGAAIAIQMSTV